MKKKLYRTLSMALCLVLLLGVFPIGAGASSSSYKVYLEGDDEDFRVYDNYEYYIDLDSGEIYEDDEDGDYIDTISISSSKGIKLSTLRSMFYSYSSSYEVVVEFYDDDGYDEDDLYTDSYVDPDDYDEIFCLVIVIDDDDYDNYYYSTYTSDYDNFEELADDYGFDFLETYELTFYWEESDDYDYSIDVEFEDENYLDPDDFYGDDDWGSSYYIVFSEPRYGDIYDDDDEVIDYDDDEILLKNLDDYYYYCDSSSAESKGYDYGDYVIYTSSGTSKVDETMYYIFDDDSSSDVTYTMAVEAGEENYFYEEIFEYFEDEEDFDLDDYSESKVYFKVVSLPTSGTLYNDGDKMSKGDTVTLDDIEDVYYYKSSASSSSTYTMTFDLYYKKSSSSTTMLIDNGTIEFTFSADTVTSFSVEFAAGTGISFYASQFVSNFTAATSTGSLKYIKIVSLPSYGVLYLNNDLVEAGDTISYSNISKLIYVPNNSTITTDSFRFSATSGSTYSSTATVLLTSAYSPDNYTLSVSGTTMKLTFDSVTTSSSQVTNTLDADDVTYILSQVSSSGSTLLVYMPITDGSTYTGRSLTIDDSFFTSTNVAKITRIILVDTTTSGYNIYLTVPTASVLSIYNSSSYSGDFTMALSAASLTDEDKSAAASSVGMARDVDMMIGVLNVSPDGAELSIPYNASNSQTNSVIMVRTGYQSYEPVLSSTWSDYMPYYSSDTTPYVTCEVESNKIYISTINSVADDFSDLASTHWGYDYISYLTARGVMSGYTGTYEGMVMPDSSVSRAEFIKMLVVALDLYDASATTTYTDVSGNASWAESYIGSAQDAGILTDSGTTFNPTEAITREDMALYAYRAASAAGITLPTSTDAITFNDADEFSSTEISNAISAMQQAGIISGEAVNGVATGDFDPSGVTTRAAAAKIISMLMELAY